MNNYELNSRGRLTPKAVGVFKVSEDTVLAVQVEVPSKKIDRVSLPKPIAVMACEMCRGGHTITDCPIIEAAPKPSKQVDFIGNAIRQQGNPYNSTYNLM